MISVIIPTYNEKEAISRLLESLKDSGECEVIIADGGSEDGTTAVVKRYPVRIVGCRKNRAVQMNRGAEDSNGDILMFVHADCVPEKNFSKAIERHIRNGYVGGCLTQKILSDRLIYRPIEASGNIRARMSRVFYGDQAIFVRRDVFFKVGGFDDVPLFEDVLFSRKIRREGKVEVVAKEIYTSPRRWEGQGVAKATLFNWIITAGFMAGVSPERLKRLYRDIQ